LHSSWCTISILVPLSFSVHLLFFFLFFFFHATAPTEIYTLSLHDALPISYQRARRPINSRSKARLPEVAGTRHTVTPIARTGQRDRKSTRLNSSHQIISYAVFCLKKKKKQNKNTDRQHKINKRMTSLTDER